MKYPYKIISLMLFLVFWSFLAKGQNSDLEKDLTKMQTFESLRLLDSMRMYAPAFLEKTEKYPKTIHRLWAMHYYSMLFYRQERETCLAMEEEAYQGFKKAGDLFGIVKTANILGSMYYHVVNDIPKSTVYFETGMEMLQKATIEEISDSLRMNYLSVFMNNLSINEKNMGNLEQAMTYATDAYQYAEKNKYYPQQLTGLMNLANIHYTIKDYEKSIELNNQLLQLSQKLKNIRFISLAINNLASGYGEQENLDSSIVYLEKGYELSKNLKDWKAVAKRAGNLGYAYGKKGLFEKAEVYYLKSLDLCKKYKLAEQELITLRFLVGNYIAKKELQKALATLNQLHPKTQKMGNKTALILNYELYYSTYQLQNNHAMALDYFKKMKALEDSVSNETVRTNIAELQTKYETAQKEKENLQLRKEAEINELKINRRNTAITLSILILGLLSLAIFLYGRQKSLKAEQQTLITNQKLKRAQLNPHFFFNALNSIQKLVATSNEKKEQLVYISKFAKLMRQTLEQSIQEFVEAEEEMESLENYMTLQKLRFKNRFDFEVINQLPKEEIYVPTQLTQPFVENSIEHGFKNLDRKGQLTIIFALTKSDLLKIEIIDNGNGLQKSEGEHKSRSQEIITERLNLFGDKKKYYFVVENQQDNGKVVGTKAVIFAPYQRL